MSRRLGQLAYGIPADSDISAAVPQAPSRRALESFVVSKSDGHYLKV